MNLLPSPHPIVAIVQARMGSTRLPRKTLAPIVGKPLLAHILERVQAVPLIDRVVIATTRLPDDDAIEALGREMGLTVYRGSVDDVLDRFYQCARQVGAHTIVRITADDPFKDPELIQAMLTYWVETFPAYDYLSNTLEPTYPEGLDIEIFTFQALALAWKEASLPSDREHVTPYIWRHPQRFRLFSWKQERDLSHLRWTVDYPEDLAFARAVYEQLYPQKPLFLMEDILALLDAEPHLKDLPRQVPRNEGYQRSRAQEEAS